MNIFKEKMEIHIWIFALMISLVVSLGWLTIILFSLLMGCN